jgi:hypothetical protein
MTEADSISESKMSRLQDLNLEKMKPVVELMGELRERRQEREEPRSGPPGPQEGVRRPWWRRGWEARPHKHPTHPSLLYAGCGIL